MAEWFAAIEQLIDVKHIQRSVRLLVVGGGRVGWYFTLLAIAHGVRWVRLIEPDRVASRNFASGLPETAVGKQKIDYFKEELRRRSSRISFEAAAVKLSLRKPQVFTKWLSGCTHVGLFIDDFPVVSGLARLAYTRCPCVYASVLENGRTGEAGWSVPRQTPCLECTARLSQKRGAQGGQTMLVDVASVTNVAFKQFMGLCLVNRRGFELFERFVHPRFCLALVVNRPGGFVETGRPDEPSAVRLVEVVDRHGEGPTCRFCRGYRP